jgi:hypothetical protein
MALTENDRRHTASGLIQATPAAIYEALITPLKLVQWLPPEGAAGKIELFEPYPGGRFKMTLTLPACEKRPVLPRVTDVGASPRRAAGADSLASFRRAPGVWTSVDVTRMLLRIINRGQALACAAVAGTERP